MLSKLYIFFKSGKSQIANVKIKQKAIQSTLLNTVNYYTRYHEDHKETKIVTKAYRTLLYIKNYFNYLNSFGAHNNPKRQA